jgi:PIN domain nuclease of toxin-antitoxin system
MRTLLDTHAFLWAISGDKRMSKTARDIFVGPSNLALSVASIWEILIKVSTGKMSLPEPVSSYLLKKLAENRIEILPIALSHVFKIESLHMHHRDPFDRILIAQSLEENWPVVSSDPVFKKYPIRVIW